MRSRFLLASLAMVACAGCQPGGDLFTLPAGDAERGKEAFVHFRCYDCHQIDGVDLPAGEEYDQALVKLGGAGTDIESYGDLVTAIVNPSHELAKGYDPVLVARDEASNMTVYNNVLTVSQLADIVAFLELHYPLRPYERTRYGEYPTRRENAIPPVAND